MLIVEDEPFIAFDLVDAVEAAGGIVVGPATTVSAALALVWTHSISAAILDVTLPDGHVGPVIDALHSRAVIVVHTGVGLPAEVAARYPDLPVYSKPTPPRDLADRLAKTLGAS